jgi:hypothetical protein
VKVHLSVFLFTPFFKVNVFLDPGHIYLQLGNPKCSERINYDTLKDLFVQSGVLPTMAATMTTGDDDNDDADLDDDKSDGVLMPTVIIDDTVVLTPVKESL